MYRITYHPLVLQQDIKEFNKKEQETILDAVYKKLSKAPESFGKRLNKELKGYFRLRIDHYRVIYEIKREQVTVYILNIGYRRDNEVYLDAVKRLKLF